MSGILADANDQGHVRLLVHLFHDESRREVWSSLQLTMPSFADMGLRPDAPDDQIWQACQKHELILITINRRAKTSDSLEETIRRLNTPESLPVITFANPARFLKDRPYAEKVADRVLEYLFDINKFRGSGRLYVP